MSMSNPVRWILCGLLLATACSSDDDDDDGGGSGSSAGSGGTQASGGSAGASSGSGARGGSSGMGGGSGSSAGRGGSSGSGGSAAGTGGGGSGGSMAVTDAGEDDANVDAGMPAPTGMCKAPVAAATNGNTCPAGAPPALKLTLIKSGLQVPIFVTQAPGDDSRLFVVHRSGRILLIDPDDGADLGEFMMVPDVADAGGDGGEMGLLGMAFHPDYPTDRRFFVNYNTDESGRQTVIASFEVMADNPDRGDPDSGDPLLTYMQPEGNHKGGMVAFGPDGCLFVASGDGGGSNDQHGTTGNGQNMNTPLGKILRLDVDNPMEAAPGNMTGGNPHIWSYGWRNPWRFSFDKTKGDMYVGDVGQGAREEVDVEPKGVGHRNYGWKIMEGAICRPGGDANCDMDGLTVPIHDYGRSGGNDCIVGGYVYRGSAITALQGWYLYGDNGPGGASGRSVWALVWDGEDSCQDTPPLISELNDFNIQSDITSFGEDNAGELYITTLNSVYRIDPAD
jgi:glucose/arabinose dehydrogenase